VASVVQSVRQSVSLTVRWPQVDVSEEEEEFQAVIIACLNVLILAIETRADAALAAMARLNWANVETVRRVTCNK
jgi:hypothetical protein